ncbi:hypothetical protein [Metallosphaera sp.]|uniref:hypothetical protein n=1 Tax=Metallosphaera sp. TaxID=2020860 RepID=UPI00316A1DD1
MPLRDELRQAVRAAWDTPDGNQLRDQLSNMETTDGYADCLHRAMMNGGGANAYKQCAIQTGVGNAIRSAWGKPPRSSARMPNVVRL